MSHGAYKAGGNDARSDKSPADMKNAPPPVRNGYYAGFNNVRMIVRAAVAGFGLACVLEDQVEAEVADGRLVRVLKDWCPPFSGYHLYYPSRRQPAPGFALLVEPRD